MEELSDLLKIRREKLQTLIDGGINPYPYRFDPTHDSAELVRRFDELAETETRTDAPTVAVCGRIASFRTKGKTSFAHLSDKGGKIQIYIRKDLIGDESYEVVKKLWDIGDYVGIEGKLFRTHSGEVTVKAEKSQLLSKAIRPLPVVKEKTLEDGTVKAFTGFENVETRYRQRYVDLALNHEVREVFIKRSRILTTIRTFLDSRGFLEVETPILQPLYGGASARPFVTHLNALDMKLYMRIALELYLKRLIIGGFDRVYEMSKIFRNEGMDRTHNPEFTMLELYQAYADYGDMMTLTESLFADVSQQVAGSHSLPYGSNTISFATPFKRAGMLDLIKEHTGVDVYPLSETELHAAAKKLALEPENHLDRGKLIDLIFSEKVEHLLIQPTFVIDYPIELSPLAKKHREKKGLVERFELYIAGSEFANAFSELNDPIDQRERFEAQMGLRARGDEEAQVLDEDFLRGMEYGMPPTGGLGIGIDRLVMLLTDQPSIRDVLLFPTMRPE